MFESQIVEEFKKAGIPRNYSPNEPVFLANEPSTGMYLIIKGEASVRRRMPTGQVEEMTTMGPGQSMGEVSLLLGIPHSATVVAKSDLETLLLTRSRLDSLRTDDPVLALRIYEILATTLARHLHERPWRG